MKSITFNRNDLLKYPEERQARAEAVEAVRQSRLRQAQDVHDLLTGNAYRRTREALDNFYAYINKETSK